jgi:hypothetical protein
VRPAVDDQVALETEFLATEFTGSYPFFPFASSTSPIGPTTGIRSS